MRRTCVNDFEVANEVFWQTFFQFTREKFYSRLLIKNSYDVIFNEQDAILNRWRECFGNFLYPSLMSLHRVVNTYLKDTRENAQITVASFSSVSRIRR